MCICAHEHVCVCVCVCVRGGIRERARHKVREGSRGQIMKGLKGHVKELGLDCVITENPLASFRPGSSIISHALEGI